MNKSCGVQDQMKIQAFRDAAEVFSGDAGTFIDGTRAGDVCVGPRPTKVWRARFGHAKLRHDVRAKRSAMIGRLALAAAVATLCQPLAAHAQAPVGYAEWILPETRGLPPGSETDRALATASPVVRDEKVNTAPRAAGDFVLERSARLLVGPDCEVTLSETLYDPRLDEVASLDLYSRLVCVVRTGESGGTIVIETPLATIVVREASATIAHAGEGAAPLPIAGTTAPLIIAGGGGGGGAGGGSIEVISNLEGGSATLLRPGFAIYVDEGGTVHEPVPTPPELLATLDSALENLAGIEPPEPLALAPDLLEIMLDRDDVDVAFPLADDVCTTTSFCDTVVVESESELLE
jgi:hypothetical protein